MSLKSLKCAFGVFILSVALTLGEPEPKEKTYLYSPIGKRDPLRPQNVELLGRSVASLDPLEKYSLEQLRLRGILRGKGNASAMFEDPDGKTYILNEGDRVGRERGTISRILNTEVIVTQKTFNYLGAENLYEKVVSLPNP